MLHFDCDYMAGAHPDILRRLAETNLRQTPGYGFDAYTRHAEQLILEACGLPTSGDATKDPRVFFLVGGTQTNATVIDGLLAHHEGVLAAETGHVNVHEAGAIEASGHKVLVLPQHNGKVAAADVDRYITDFYRDETYQHMVAPGMLYISFPTELGTLYSLAELQDLHRVCQHHHIPLYIDGARLGYGLAASSDVTLCDITNLSDVFYIGGTKVGALFGEAVVVKDITRLPHFMTLIKQHGALLAKGRLLGIQFETLFTDDLYMRLSRHAVAMAMKLKAAFTAHGFRLYIDSPTNQQFFILPNTDMDALMQHASFEVWGTRGEQETPVRFVTDWSTREEDIDALIHYFP